MSRENSAMGTYNVFMSMHGEHGILIPRLSVYRLILGPSQPHLNGLCQTGMGGVL